MKHKLLLLLIPIMVLTSCEKKDPYRWLPDNTICIRGDFDVPAEGGTVTVRIICRAPLLLLGPKRDIDLLSDERDTICGTWYKAYRRQEDQYTTNLVVEAKNNDTGARRYLSFVVMNEQYDYGEVIEMSQESE